MWEIEFKVFCFVLLPFYLFLRRLLTNSVEGCFAVFHKLVLGHYIASKKKWKALVPPLRKVGRTIVLAR